MLRPSSSPEVPRADCRGRDIVADKAGVGGMGDGSAQATAAAIVTLVETAAQNTLEGCEMVVESVGPDKAAATAAGDRHRRGHSTARGRRRGGRRHGRGPRRRPAGGGEERGPPLRTTPRHVHGGRRLRGRGRETAAADAAASQSPRTSPLWT